MPEYSSLLTTSKKEITNMGLFTCVLALQIPPGVDAEVSI